MPSRLFKSLSEEPEKLLVGESGLTNDGLDDVFWQIEPFVIGHGDASGSVGMFQLHVRTGDLVYLVAGFLRARTTSRGLRLANLGAMP